MLEDVLHPKKLYWLAHAEMRSADPLHWRGVAALIADCMCRHRARSALYLSEVMKVYCSICSQIEGIDHFGTTAFNFNECVLVGNSTPACDANVVRRLVSEITVSTGNSSNAQRLLLAHLQVTLFASLAHAESEPDPDDDGSNNDRLVRLLVNFSNECTFKTHGDFLVHAVLIVTKLPPWVSSMLCENDMPYPLMVQSYPTTVNKEVRPLLDPSMDERLLAVRWDAPGLVPADYILAVSLVLEIVASPSMALLVNGTMLHNLGSPEPQPFIVRNSDASVSTGCRHNSVFYHDDTSLTTVERVLRWLRFTHATGSTLTASTCEIVMNNLTVSARNPLRKYAL